MCLAGDRPQGTGGDQAQAIGSLRTPLGHGRASCIDATSCGARFQPLAPPSPHRAPAPPPTRRPPTKLKVVYHLNDLDKVAFVLGNIQNHFDGVGGPDHVTIALVDPRPGAEVVSLGCREPGYHQARRLNLPKRARTRRLRQHHEIAEGRVDRPAAGLCPCRPGRRGPDRGTAVAGLSVSAALSPRPAAVTKSRRSPG